MKGDSDVSIKQNQIRVSCCTPVHRTYHHGAVTQRSHACVGSKKTNPNPNPPTPTAVPTATPTAPPDFALWTNRMSPWWTGYLVRGGLRMVDCPLCQGDFEPRYITFDYGECSYANNTIEVVSHNGFEGTITLEIVNLPPGVTSRTATSIFLRRYNRFGIGCEHHQRVG